VFRDLMLHPIVDALMDCSARLPGLQLHRNIAHPGGEPMVLHTDQGYLGFWTPKPVVANIA